MKCYLQFLTSPTADTPGTTLLLHFDNKRYLIGNVSEGTQRAANQMGARLLRVSDMLITGRTEWRNIGGLIGMVLTLADVNAGAAAAAKLSWRQKTAAGKNAGMLRLYGGANLNHALGTCRRYVFRKGMPLVVQEVRDEPLKRDENGGVAPMWQDENISVWALAVAPEKKALDAEAAAVANLKKRGFDELNSFEDYVAPEGETAEEREIRYDGIRKAVVRHMFDSNWDFDTLVEQPLSEVRMPATIFVRNPETRKIEKYAGPMPSGQEPVPDITVMVRTPWPAALLENLPPTEPSLDAISYIICNHPQRGKFNPERAIELEVEKGFRWAQLTQGNSVTNKRGKVITPDMVLGEGRLGQGVAVVDLPSPDYVEPLVNREEWTSKDVMGGIRAFVWILGPGVAAHPTLQQFMEKMSDVKHIISSPDQCPNRLSLDSVASSTLRLAQIDPDRYPVLYHDNVTVPQAAFNLPTSGKTALPENTILADRGLTIDLEPAFNIASEKIVPLLDTAEVLRSTPEDVLALAQAARSDIQASAPSLSAWKRSIPHPDTEIITLGTGSALPSKYRNVSATLVRVPGVGSYLLDCGENTLGQLQRVFPPTELADVLRDLRLIWISHLHADHHLGTTSLIKAWYRVMHNCVPASSPPNLTPSPNSAPEQTLAVVSDTGMLYWLHEYASVEDYGYSRLLPLAISAAKPWRGDTSSLSLFPPPSAAPTHEDEYILQQRHYPALLGLSDIQAVNVNHCLGAKAVALTFPLAPPSPAPSLTISPSPATASETLLASQTPATPPLDPQPLKPLKIAYSGDCRPSRDFGLVGRDATVLVHEATFDDELAADAAAKKHSTTSEALGVGARMGARAVVLTHFSQRYQKIPVLETIEGEEEEEEEDGEEGGREGDGEEGGEGEGLGVVGGGEEGRMEGVVRSLSGSGSGSAAAAALAVASNERVVRVRARDMKVAVAFDYMKVRIGDIAALEKFNPALSRLFEVDAGEEEEAVVIEKGKGKEGGKKKGGVAEGEGEGGKKKKAKRNN